MANDPLALRPYYAALSAAFTSKSSLSTLLKNAYANLSNPIKIPDITATEILLFAPPGNGASLIIGDENLSTTNYGYLIDANGSRRYGPFSTSSIPLTDMYIMPADGATSVQVAIEAIPA